jgi:hypothetical protein
MFTESPHTAALIDGLFRDKNRPHKLKELSAALQEDP